MASLGDLWIVDFGDPYPGEPANRRPALILGPPESFGTALPFVIVVPLTTTDRSLSIHVEIDPTDETGLDETSFAQCELIRSVNRDRLVHRLGNIDPVASTRVKSIVKTLLDH